MHGAQRERNGTIFGDNGLVSNKGGGDTCDGSKGFNIPMKMARVARIVLHTIAHYCSTQWEHFPLSRRFGAMNQWTEKREKAPMCMILLRSNTLRSMG